MYEQMQDQIRRLKMMVFVLFVVALGYGLFIGGPGDAGAQSGGDQSVIRARRFVVTDEHGDNLAVLGTEGGDESAALAFKWPDSDAQCITLGQRQGVAGLNFYDERGTSRVISGYTDEQAMLMILDRDENPIWFRPTE